MKTFKDFCDETSCYEGNKWIWQAAEKATEQRVIAIRETWQAAKKATEQRVIEDVDVIFRHLANDDCTIAYAIDKFKELKQKHEVKDDTAR